MSTKPEALQIADELDSTCPYFNTKQAAAELRRLYEVNQMLVEASEIALDVLVNTGLRWRMIEGAKEALRQALSQHNDYLKNALEEEWRNGYRVGKQDALAQDSLRELAEIDHELGLYVDTVNKSQSRVDETAKRGHEPVAYSGNGTAGRDADVQPTGFFIQMPKREWAGLSVSKAEELIGEFENDPIEMLFALDKYLREKNGHV